ncbi:MAG: CoA transferase [Chromatiales bacterium]|jgi:crotonobetainyl-CoA:carnitine CoA-transferase CaiB-like acyl-CoA transferase|nr:CoA transferase [Chromatiales bacterium]
MSLLEGIKVIDAASFIAGPAATTVLADFGADVIKIEPPGTGDTYRNRSAPGNPDCDVNYAWIVDNRNKRGVTLDLKSAKGREVLYTLVRQADVFVTNLPFPARGRLKVTYEDLSPLNERLIYGSVSAYGESGDEADNPGFDSTALWARTSLMDMTKPAPDSAPARSLPGMGDHPTAMSLFGGIMAALYRREKTGTGTYVSTSLMANGLWWNAIQVQAMLCGAEFDKRPPREAATTALHNLYQTRDGRWFHLVCIPEDKRWASLLDAVGRRTLADDPRFVTREARHANVPALIAILDEVFIQHDWAHWKPVLDGANIPFGVIGTLRDIPADQQMQDSDALTPIADARAQADFIVNSPVWLRDAPKVAPRLAPDIGEHTDEVLRETGFSAKEIAQLRDDGAVG